MYWFGPNCATWPRILTENPYRSPHVGPRFGPTLSIFVEQNLREGHPVQTIARLPVHPCIVVQGQGWLKNHHGIAEKELHPSPSKRQVRVWR